MIWRLLSDSGSLMPLHWATYSKGPEDVTLLLDSGASIDAQDEDGLTPLMVAILSERSDNCKTLLARGANMHLRDMKAEPALHFACRRHDTSITKLLLKYGADIEATNNCGGTTLWCAAFLGNKEFVKFLLRNGAKLESKVVDRMTPLHTACAAGQEAVVRYLIAYGADADMIDDCGMTTLWHATRGGDIRIIKLLLETTTININAQIYNGQTALSIAVRQRDKAIVKVLLKAGAEILPQEPGPHVPFLDPDKRLKDYGADALVEAGGLEHRGVGCTVLKAGAKIDPAEYARWLLVWDGAEPEELKTMVAWVNNVRRARGNSPKIRALRRAMIKKVREHEVGNARKVAEEIGVPFVALDFGTRDSLEPSSEDESEMESGDD